MRPLALVYGLGAVLLLAHASEKTISPKQTNQSPYTRQKKG